MLQNEESARWSFRIRPPVSQSSADGSPVGGGISTGRLSTLQRMILRGWLRIAHWFNEREFDEHAVLMVFAAVLGVLAALGVATFYGTIDLAYKVFYKFPAEHLSGFTVFAYRPVVTAAGLTTAWWVMKYLGRDHDGMNVPDIQRAVVRFGGRVPTRPALARTLASAITIGGGGVAGNEGPVVVLGSTVGSAVGRMFRFTPSRVRLMVGCAAGASISAAFNAPLAGAFFALEEILGAFSATTFAPVVISSVLAAVVSRAIFGNHPAFPIPDDYGYATLVELVVFYPLLGLVIAAFAVAYVRLYFANGTLAAELRKRFDGWRFPSATIAILGGLVVGAMVVLSDGRLVGYGHFAMTVDVFGRLPWYVLFGLAVGGILATTVTLNFGGSGGVFTPSLYMGAAAGGGFGAVLATFMPALGVHPEPYALVGMAAMVAAATDAPITGILLVFEMTNDYAIMLPLMLTVVVAHTVARRVEKDSLYSGWLRRRGEHIAHGTDHDALAVLRVDSVYERDPQLIEEDATVPDMLRLLDGMPQSALEAICVVDASGGLVGMLSAADVLHAASHRAELESIVLAGDLATRTEVVRTDDSLRTVMRRMGQRGREALPVISGETGEVLGLIRREHVLAAYERAVQDLDGLVR